MRCTSMALYHPAFVQKSVEVHLRCDISSLGCVLGKEQEWFLGGILAKETIILYPFSTDIN